MSGLVKHMTACLICSTEFKPQSTISNQILLSTLKTNKYDRPAITNILRFWMTPSRQRVCSCGERTCRISYHLLFNCSKTYHLVVQYASTLPDKIAKLLTSQYIKRSLSQLTSNHLLKAFREFQPTPW